MRLIELALDAYGPFAGVKLDFDRTARLHIVYGPNEAGKTCALAAIGDLLYGVPPRAEKNFLRPADLRLGATLEARNGQMLQFFRRRGGKAALLDASGAALAEDCLAPFLGSASREIFGRAFGLDAKALREGGAEMLRAEGEIGASLFAAASGLRGLIDLRRGLEAEAEKVFGERKAEHRSFYQALGRFDDARRAEKDATLSEGALKSLRRQIEEAGEQLDAVGAQDRVEEGERLHLQRMLKAAPMLRKLAGLRESLAGFDDLSRFGDDWAARLETLLTSQDEARKNFGRAAQDRDEAGAEVELASFDADLLARAEEIEALNRAAGAMEKATLDDLPRREKALDKISDKLRLRALACGLADSEALRAAAPDPAQLLRAEKLVARGRELAAEKSGPASALEREQRALDDLRARQGAELPDSRALAEKLAAFGAVEKDDDARADLALACADEARQIDERRARLSPALADLDLFARSPSPEAGAIEQAAQAFDALAAREVEAARKIAEAREKASGAEARLRALQRSGPIFGRGDLLALRERRDALWPDLGEARADEAAWRKKSGEFRALQDQADSIADSLLADAARVAEAEAERENLAAARKSGEEAERFAEAARDERARLEAAWARDWATCGVSAAAPRVMSSWRESAINLLAARQSLRAKQDRLAASEQRLRQALPGLHALAGEAGLAPLPLEAGPLARRIAGRIKDLARAEDEAREVSAQIAAAPARIKDLQARLAALADDGRKWRADYDVALGQLRLDADASFDEAQARIALWRDLPRDLQEEAGERHRVGAIRDDLLAFEQRLDALLASCALNIPPRPALDAAKTLQKRLAVERGRQTTRAHAEKLFARADAAAAQAQQAATAAESLLAALCGDAAWSGDAVELCQKLRGRRELSGALAEESERLALVAEGADEAKLAEQARDFDADAARLRLGEIERSAEARRRREHELIVAQHEANSQLARLDEGFGAEQAIFARESARAEISTEARRWAVLKMAALMVGAGLEKHRQARQDPLLARAGDIYSSLTSGRYHGLKQDFGEDDRLHLLARRADGADLPLGALSEGACDQLYLALRLAFLEDYARKSEAPPFIGDDLFASFDDARVAAGLKTVAGLSPLLQPIIFTHHAHIVGIARETLGDAAQILRLQ